MVTEIAQVEIRPGSGGEFESAVAEAVPLFESAAGCHGVRLVRGHEHPERYRLFVEWETVEHHTETFRSSPAYARWRELVGPFFATAPEVEHVHEVPVAGMP